MPSSAGIDAQIGIAEEGTYGTYTAPTRFYEFLSESLKLEIERVWSTGLRAGRRTHHRWRAGTRSVTGDIQMELAPQDFALIWKHILGAPVTSGAGPYTHTFSGPKTTDTFSFTIQVGRPDEAGTVQPFSYLGCKITQAKLEAKVGDFVKSTFGIYGRDETTAQSLGTAAYDANLAPFIFTDASLSVASTDVPVMDFDFTFNPTLATGRHRITATNPGLPKISLANGLAEISGKFTADFANLTQYQRYVNGTEAALVLNFNNGAASQMSITMNVRFDGETPNVNGPTLLQINVPFVAVSSSTDAAAMTVVVTNSDSTP